MSDKPIWTPDPARAARTAMAQFMARAGGFADYAALHRWSVEHSSEFWSLLWDFCGVQGEKGGRGGGGGRGRARGGAGGRRGGGGGAGGGGWGWVV